jgi:hypothetical protein
MMATRERAMKALPRPALALERAPARARAAADGQSNPPLDTDEKKRRATAVERVSLYGTGSGIS